MANMTLAIPAELKKEMDKLAFVNWSEIARTAIKEKILQFQVIEEITKNSKFTEKDALELGAKVNKGISDRLRKKFLEKKGKQ